MMQAGTFAVGWDEDRRPLPDEADDALRRGRYWDWSNRFGPELGHDAAPRIGTAPDGRGWHRLEDAAQADFEAFHMQHSIGYNWDHYSGFGEIYSLRSDGIPEATLLVSDGVVVHARRRANEPLAPADLAAVWDLAAERGWQVRAPDQL